jgi:Zn-dependent protease with chaperone function
MNRQPSLAGRALLAIGLMIGFYLLAVGIAGGLLAIPYLEMVSVHRLHIKLALFCVVGAGVILWSILPRPDRFPPPGPALTEKRHPSLFRTIESVARATGQEMPAEVYLVADMNAWVAQRGGVMGIGSRRVMGLGLPLLQVLTLSQFRAVLAHEFGHYHGGDTRLGPWIYKTRAAIGRTLAGMSRHSEALRKPFEWYGSLFLRVTHAISRRQELTADALASRVEGSRALVEGLRRVAGMSAAYNHYWASEVHPVLAAGFLPPIADGLRRFVGVESISGQIAQMVEAEIREGKADPYDTHPPLRERIEAVRDLPADPGPAAGASAEEAHSALSLLEDVGSLERELLTFLADASTVESIKPLPWEKVGSAVIAPAWERAVGANRAAFAGLTVANLPDAASRLADFEARLEQRPEGIDESGREQRGAWFLGAGLGLALRGAGWTVKSLPGDPIRLFRNGDTIEPFEMVSDLAGGKLTAELWQERCAGLGIDTIRLEPA